MRGVYLVIIGILSLLASVLWKKATDSKASEKAGKAVSQAREETARAELEARTAETEKSLAQDVTPVAVGLASEKAKAEAEYLTMTRELEAARMVNDVETAMRIESELARKALERGASEIKR